MDAAESTPAGSGFPDRISAALRDAWNHHLLELDGSWITPGRICIALLAFIVGMVLARWLSRRAVTRLLTGMHVAETTSTTLRTLIHYLLVVIVLFIALQTAGIPLTAFTIFGGALAIGIGFGSQNILNNFISGLIMLIERPVKPGDLVEIDDCIGIVQRIGARATLITDYKGITHLIPNSHFVENAVTNWHYSDDLVCGSITVGVIFGSDTALVARLLTEAATSHDKITDTPPPQVLFNEFSDDALIFELLVWIHARRVIERRRVESDLRFAIDASFRANGITVAFPQRDVHLDARNPLPVRVIAGD